MPAEKGRIATVCIIVTAALQGCGGINFDVEKTYRILK